MSQNLIAVSTQLPDFLRELGGYKDENMSAGVTPKAPKLACTTAKEFTITRDGKTMILPRDEKGQAVFRGVLVAASQTLTKAWYEKAYVPGSTEAPDCYSNDGKVPAPGVAKKQCNNCAGCPKNAFGSHPVTGRGKACGDRKLVVLVWEGDPETLMTWNVPTMSLQSLRKIDNDLRNANIPLQSVMVQLTFDPGVTYPVVQIGALGFVDKGTVLRLREMAQTEEVSQLLREVDYDVEETPTAASNPVPNQQITFGQNQQPAVEVGGPATGNTAAAQVNTQTGEITGGGAGQAQQPVDPPKRRRATKAEMEARRAAEQQSSQPAATTQPPMQTEQAPVVDPAAAQIAALQAQLAALQGGQNVAASQPASTVLPGNEGQQFQLNGQTLQVPENGYTTGAAAQQAAQHALQPENQRVEPAQTAAPAGQPDVLGLLSKWANG